MASPIVTPQQAYKMADLTASQKELIKNSLEIYGNEVFDSVKTGINHVIDIVELKDKFVYLMNNDNIIRNGDTVTDNNANAYTIKMKGADYVPAFWKAKVSIENGKAVVSRSDYFKDFSGEALSEFGHIGVGIGEFSTPKGIFVTKTNIYIVDSANSRVQIFNLNFGIFTEFGSFGTADGQFDSPDGIFVTESNIYIVDTGNNRIQTFDLNGVYVSKFGVIGTDDGDFHVPTSIYINESNIFIGENNGARIQRFNLSWIFETKTVNFHPCYSIYIDNGKIYSTDKNSRKVRIFDLNCVEVLDFGETGSADSELQSPIGIVATETNIYVADSVNDKIKVFDLIGGFVKTIGAVGNELSQFSSPSNIAITQNKIYVVDTGNNRIQTFN